MVLQQGSNRAVVLGLESAPPTAAWHVQRRENTWLVLLRVPNTAPRATLDVRLNVWVPYRDDPVLLKELGSRRD